MSEYRISIDGREFTAEEYAAYELEQATRYPCPICGAQPGERCVTDPRKGEMPGTHAARRNG